MRRKKSASNGSKKPPRSRHKKPERIYDFPEADDRLHDIFRNHEFGDYPHDKRHQLVRFYQLLMQQQTQENFTRLTKFRDIAIKHFIDSLIITRFTDLAFPLLDVGTGPGFPGIPLKIEYPEQKIILAEGVRKRVEFLKTVREKMDLPNLDVIGRNVSPEFAYPVQGVITRAVEEAKKTLWNVSQCLQIGGKVFLMKGPGAEKEIEPAMKEFGQYYELSADIAYNLPKTPHERRLLIFEKVAPVPYTPEEA